MTDARRVFRYRFVGQVVEETAGAAVATVGPHCVIWAQRAFPLREGVTVIGRADDADVQIVLPSVSRHHARIVTGGLAASLEDLQSRDGTWCEALRAARTARYWSAPSSLARAIAM